MRFRRLPALLLLLCALVVPAAAGAQEGVYTISGVPVDATAETAAAARETAHAQGHVSALQTLFQRLVLDEDLPRLPVLSAEQIADFVSDFSVADERTSPGRYRALLTFRFKPAAVRNLLQQAAVRFAETRSKPVLVLPVYGAGEAAALWEEPNPWREAWATTDLDEGLVPLLTPLGDLADFAQIDAARALAGDGTQIAAMTARYGAGDVLVAQATPSGDPEQELTAVGVVMSRLGPNGLEPLGQVSYLKIPDEDLAGLLGRAVAGTAAVVRGQWKQRNLLNFGTRQNLVVDVPIDDLRQWLEVKRRLDNVASVLSSDLLSLRRDRAQVNLTFIGDIDQLALALAQSDLSLNPAVGNGPSGTVAGGLSTVVTPSGVSTGAVPARGNGAAWELHLRGAGG